jgi:hypothetical protein
MPSTPNSTSTKQPSAPKLPVGLTSGSHSFSGQYVKQDTKGIAVTLNVGASVRLDIVGVSNGCIFWGHGGKSAELHNVYSDGVPDKYAICNFDHPLDSLVIDNSGTNKVIQQGEHEAAVRIMQVTNLLVVGLKVKGHKYKDDKGKWHYWKQAVQDRSGGQHIWRNCEIEGPVDIGYMTDPNIPIQPLTRSRWENCTLSEWPAIRDGVQRVEYVNCVIAGQHVVSKVINKSHV